MQRDRLHMFVWSPILWTIKGVRHDMCYLHTDSVHSLHLVGFNQKQQNQQNWYDLWHCFHCLQLFFWNSLFWDKQESSVISRVLGHFFL